MLVSETNTFVDKNHVVGRQVFFKMRSSVGMPLLLNSFEKVLETFGISTSPIQSTAAPISFSSPKR